MYSSSSSGNVAALMLEMWLLSREMWLPHCSLVRFSSLLERCGGSLGSCGGSLWICYSSLGKCCGSLIGDTDTVWCVIESESDKWGPFLEVKKQRLFKIG